MLALKKHVLCQGLAVVLALLIAFEAGYVFGQEQTPESLYVLARQDFANGDFAAAREALLKAAGGVDENVPENRTFLGYVYLLLGASEENLGNSESAKAAYAKAKELLSGKEAKIEGVNFVGLGLYLETFGTTQQLTEAEMLRGKFDEAKKAYLAGDYAGAKNLLEELAAKLASLEGWMSLRGETYLLLGASYEKLDYKDLAISYYCKAKEILGKGKTNEGLDLDSLKYYDRECQTVAARTGAKKGSSLGKILGTVLTLALIGGAVWYLFFSKNAPFKPKGAYTSVTLKLTVTFKGMNSKGTRKVTLNGTEHLNEAFLYTQKGTDTSVCADCTKSETYSYTFEVPGTGFNAKLNYIDWDYNDHSTPAFKMLCSDWNFDVVSYKWESGKKDPGKPSIEGIDQLTMDVDTDCVEKTIWVHDCEMSANLTFKAPSGAAVTGQAATSTVSKRTN